LEFLLVPSEQGLGHHALEINCRVRLKSVFSVPPIEFRLRTAIRHGPRNNQVGVLTGSDLLERSNPETIER
jgi:hypothetical protein